MKKKVLDWCRQIAIGFLAALLLGPGLPVAAAEQEKEIQISAQSAVVMAADSELVLYEKEKDAKLPMASTTKIMTALLALEKAEEAGNPVVEITGEMVMVEGSSMGLREGDRLTLTGIVQGMMLCSGNDAANAIALYLGGTAEGFAELMNRRAKEIGMENTNFVTASGLDDEMHYTSAYDLALLAAVALKNTKFVEICSSRQLQVEFENPQKSVWYSNHNKLLSMYTGCIGMKTGFTKKSGRCLVSAAQREGVTLVAVTINAPDDWNDHTKLLDAGFEEVARQVFDESAFHIQVPVVGGTAETVMAQGAFGAAVTIRKADVQAIRRVVHLPKFLYAPVEQGCTVGVVEYYAGDKKLFSLPLKAAKAIRYQEKKGIWERIFH